MAKNDEKTDESQRHVPADVDLVNELRELVKGGAAYEARKPAGKPNTVSHIVNGFSDERRTPSRLGLPRWKASATQSGLQPNALESASDPAPNEASGGTDPGLGPASQGLPQDVLDTHIGHLTTVELPLTRTGKSEGRVLGEMSEIAGTTTREADTSHSTESAPDTKSEPPKGRVLRREEVEPAPPREQNGALLGGRSVTLPDGDKGALAERIAEQVRGRLGENTNDSPTGSRDASTVMGQDAIPEAPPVESRREEKRTELRIGVVAGMLTTLILGVLIGRWFWQDRGEGTGVSGPSLTVSALGPAAPVVTSQSNVTSLSTATPSTPSTLAPGVSPTVSASSEKPTHAPKHGPDSVGPKASAGARIEPGPAPFASSGAPAVPAPGSAVPPAPPTARSGGPAPTVSVPFGSYMEEKTQ